MVERRGPIETKMTAMCCLLSVFRPTRAWSNSLSASTGVIKAEIANGRTGGPIKQIQHPNKLMIDIIQHKCSYCIFIIFVVSNTFLCGAFASNNICNRCNVRNKTENWHNLDTSKNTRRRQVSENYYHDRLTIKLQPIKCHLQEHKTSYLFPSISLWLFVKKKMSFSSNGIL